MDHWSIEAHRFVEFAATIPSAMQRDAGGGKQSLKNAMRRLVPSPILTKRKTGFGVPLAQWFRGELVEFLRGTLLDDRARRRNLFAPRFLSWLVEEHTTGRRGMRYRDTTADPAFGAAESRANGMKFDPSTGTLYASVVNNVAEQGGGRRRDAHRPNGSRPGCYRDRD